MSIMFLPQFVNPFICAAQHDHLEGQVSLLSMHRLSEQTGISQTACASLSIQFVQNEQNLPLMTGNIRAPLALQCQRCLEPFVYEIMTSFTLIIVKTPEAIKSLAKHHEAIVIKTEMIVFSEFVEEELLLNLPIVPKHAVNVCKVMMPIIAQANEAPLTNSFKILSSLKQED